MKTYEKYIYLGSLPTPQGVCSGCFASLGELDSLQLQQAAIQAHMRRLFSCTVSKRGLDYQRNKVKICLLFLLCFLRIFFIILFCHKKICVSVFFSIVLF